MSVKYKFRSDDITEPNTNSKYFFRNYLGESSTNADPAGTFAPVAAYAGTALWSLFFYGTGS